MRLNSYVIVERAVEEGIAYGYRRAFKHTETPDHESIKYEIHAAVLSSLCEVMQFDHGDEFWGDQLAEVLLEAGGSLSIGRAAYRAKIPDSGVTACIADEPDRFVRTGNAVALVQK